MEGLLNLLSGRVVLELKDAGFILYTGETYWSRLIGTQYSSPWLAKAFRKEVDDTWIEPEDGNPGDFTIRVQPQKDDSSGAVTIVGIEWYVTLTNTPSFIGT